MATKQEIQPKGPIQIDVGAVLKTRGLRMPRWIVRFLEKLICQDELNKMLSAAYPRRGADFCQAVIRHLGIGVKISNEHLLPDKANRRVIIVSNHPLGGLDGMILIDYIRNRYDCEPRFIVNDLLMAVEPLSDVFLPINKHGCQSRQAASAIDEAMGADVPVIIFPAGLCSRRRHGHIADLEWKKMFVQKAREYGRDIIPLRFEAQNSAGFYRIARMRELIGIRFNIEMVLLPGEIFKAKGKSFKIICGSPIPASSLSTNLPNETQRIRSIVDNLNSTEKQDEPENH